MIATTGRTTGLPIRRTFSPAERLAALAGLAAAVASLAGFIPGLYRDPGVVIGQSHGYDAGNLLVVAVLGLGLAASGRGSLRGRLVAIGALGCLLYSYVTYGFEIVLNPATPLYIAVLGFGGWSFVAGLAAVDDREAEALLSGSRTRRVIAGFLLLMALLFALTSLRQIASAVTSGQLPAELRNAGWPMNPIWVLDLGFVLPLMVLTAVRLLRHRARGARAAVPLLVFMPLLGVTILAMAVSSALDGQPLDLFMPTLFIVIVLSGAGLAWLALGRHRHLPTGARTDARPATD